MNAPTNVRYRGQSGHRADLPPCPLMTLFGHCAALLVPAIFLDSVLAKAQLHFDRDVNARRSGFQSNLSIGTLLSAPFPRSEACRANGNPMRTLVEPPPSSHCNQCGGELRLQQIERANDTLDLDIQILVCAECGREHSCTVNHLDPKSNRGGGAEGNSRGP